MPDDRFIPFRGERTHGLIPKSVTAKQVNWFTEEGSYFSPALIIANARTDYVWQIVLTKEQMLELATSILEQQEDWV